MWRICDACVLDVTGWMDSPFFLRRGSLDIVFGDALALPGLFSAPPLVGTFPSAVKKRCVMVRLQTIEAQKWQKICEGHPISNHTHTHAAHSIPLFCCILLTTISIYLSTLPKHGGAEEHAFDVQFQISQIMLFFLTELRLFLSFTAIQH